MKNWMGLTVVALISVILVVQGAMLFLPNQIALCLAAFTPLVASVFLGCGWMLRALELSNAPSKWDRTKEQRWYYDASTTATLASVFFIVASCLCWALAWYIPSWEKHFMVGMWSKWFLGVVSMVTSAITAHLSRPDRNR